MNKPTRKKGSCRFGTYYKVQYMNRLMCWQDVQKTYASENEARAAFVPGVNCRVMKVTEKGRGPI